MRVFVMCAKSIRKPTLKSGRKLSCHMRTANVWIICAFAESDQGLYSLISSALFYDSVNEQWIPWWDCADAQVDKDLRSPYMPVREGFRVEHRHITKTRPFKHIENFITKKWIFSDKKILIFFLISTQNIDCGNTLEPPRRGYIFTII